MSNTNGTITLIPPPDGYVVDFENPQLHYVTESYTIAAVEMTLCLLFLMQRLYTKIVLMKSFQLEDALVIIAWIFCTATQVDLFIGLAGGAIGVHAWEMSIDKYAFYSRVILAAPLLYMPGTAAAKMSLALFYRRLNPNKIFQAFVWGTLIVSTAGYVACWFSLLFACKPIAAGWDPLLLPDAVCINIGAIYLSQATVGIVTDVFLMAIPIPTLVKLQMNTRKKLGLALIFCVGSLTIVTSIIRLVVLIPSLTSTDQPWVVGEGVLWIFIEANLLIMCCCLATLRRFMRHFAPRLIGEDSSTGKNSKPSNFRNQGLRTFGSAGTAKRTFDTLMQTNKTDNGIALSSIDDLDKTGGQTTTTKLKTKGKDSDSEEAILFERSVQVSYEDTHGLHNSDDREAGARGYGSESAVSHQPRIWTGGRRPSAHGR